MTDRRTHRSASPWEPRFGFSRAVRVGGHVFVAGTGPVGVDERALVDRDPTAQSARAFAIALDALTEVGGAVTDVVRTRMFITDVAHADAVGEVHRGLFGTVAPAATMVVVRELVDPRWVVEVELDAIVTAT